MASGSFGVIELVELMAEAMTIPCLLLDCTPSGEARILYVNPAFTRLTGYSRDELVGDAVKKLSSVAEASVLHRIHVAMRNGLPVRGVKTNMRKTGEVYSCELTVRPLHDASGRLSHYIVFEREVRRRRGRPPQTGQRFEPVVAGEGDEDRFFSVD